ncbi:XRE family transcriptional regulator [Streptomyces radiopugnans]|uniref:XRE family transcriptional regulator n=1 Tax=Streptomyces radiopugnans TaxID=403935 RepID=UPI003F19BB1B
MKSWKDVRPGIVTDETHVAERRRAMASEARAYRLAQIRKERALRQADVAAAMGVRQPRVSQIENGEIDATEIATLRSYVEALGGHLELIADFGDTQVRIA